MFSSQPQYSTTFLYTELTNLAMMRMNFAYLPKLNTMLVFSQEWMPSSLDKG